MNAPLILFFVGCLLNMPLGSIFYLYYSSSYNSADIFNVPLMILDGAGNKFSLFFRMSGWLTGGFIYNDKGVLQALKTTEKIIDGISVEAGPDLPFNLAGHCTVHIGGDLFLVAGGFQNDYKSPSKKVFIQVK